MLQKHERYALTTLRLTLAVIFVWFGLLKIFGFNPVYDLVHHSLVPFLADGTGLIVLGIVETLIGLLLFSNKLLTLTHTILFLHLLGTFSTFIFGWHIVFDPYFPVLSLPGEFVIKNMTLAVAGIVILLLEKHRRASHQT